MLRTELQEEEEFQEADILWPDAAQDLELPQMYYSHVDGDDGHEHSDELRATKPHNRQKASSPIDIPRKTSATGAKGTKAQSGFSKLGASRAGAGGSSVIIGSQVFMPPHVIVDRRAKRDAAMMIDIDVRRALVPNGRVRAMMMRKYY